eukprot:evm.model.scf_1283.1 EVM.evm.TU.scf_1283.1   scf_1283:17803-23456(-)
MQAVTQYLRQVAKALHSKNGKALRNLLVLDNPLGLAAAMEAARTGRSITPIINQTITNLDDDTDSWRRFTTGHCQCLVSMHNGQWQEAYESFAAVVSTFNSIFRDDQVGWCVPAMRAVTGNLRLLAEHADLERKRQGDRPEKLEGVGDVLRNCFSVACQSKNINKKLAALGIANVLMRVYFQLSKLQLCLSIMRSVEAPNFLAFEHFPASDRVTFKYYAGRIAVVEQRYITAEECLTYAFTNCHHKAQNNIRKILQFLIPVRMVMGRLPTTGLLQHHNLMMFAPVAEALRKGDVGAFQATLRANRFTYIQTDTFIPLEHLQLTVYRQLLRIAHRIHAEVQPEKASKMPIKAFTCALRLQGVDMPERHAMCTLANLIYHNHIKGYLSYNHEVVVFSKLTPFPDLKAVEHGWMKNERS